MRSAKETGCFPYGSGQVCYMEVSPDGAVTQLSTVGEKRSAYIQKLESMTDAEFDELYIMPDGMVDD